jgi:hypothetical protein
MIAALGSHTLACDSHTLESSKRFAIELHDEQRELRPILRQRGRIVWRRRRAR